MKKFTHINANTVNEAVDLLGEYGDSASVIAGGTDLLGELVLRSRREQPEYIINLKTIGLNSINTTSSGITIGALTPLHDIAFSSDVLSDYPALAQAARKVASWQIRNMGTIGGNICQDVRCMYFRSSGNKFDCIRKGGALCYSTLGDNRFNSIFAGAAGCIAVSPSDTAPVLVALDATIVTSSRSIAAEDFFDGLNTTVLANDEIVTEIQIPTPASGSKQSFVKASIRRAIDFALASAAVFVTSDDARVVMGGVAPTPYRATGAEDAIKGQAISESVADAAAAAAVSGAVKLTTNGYRIQVAKGVVKKAVL
ncbi:MAG: FAD binding domain-containing protein, partial [Dehalococcoidia bacterium]